MKVYRELRIGDKKAERSIFFGEPDTEEEKEEMFRLRYQAYSYRNYIDSEKYPDGLEKDEYDGSGKCVYFIAKIGEKVIGTIRLIIDRPLPTEKCFTFAEPQQLKAILPEKRCELGRFIIIPPDKKSGDYLPRGLVMLFLLDTLSNYGVKRDFLGGYSFIKSSLDKKFKKMKIPVIDIPEYKQHYPSDGVLYKYFTQADDPVIPIGFLTSDFLKYSEKIIHNLRMFAKISDTVFVLKSNLYTAFLKKLRII